MASARSPDGQFRRLACAARATVICEIDGRRVEALEGDTVLTAVLTNQRHARQFEFGPDKRAGFCLIGACQDCWIRFADGSAARGCTTLIRDGMKLVTVSQ